MAAGSAFAVAPTSIRQVADGWEYQFVLGRPTEFNHVTIEEVGSAARGWKLYADNWYFAKGDSIGPKCEANLGKATINQTVTIAVKAGKKPDIRDLSVSMVPLADGIDSKLMKVTQKDDRTAFVEFVLN